MVFGFVTYDMTWFAMTAPTDSLMTDWMGEEDIVVGGRERVKVKRWKLWETDNELPKSKAGALKKKKNG